MEHNPFDLMLKLHEEQAQVLQFIIDELKALRRAVEATPHLVDYREPKWPEPPF